MDTTPKAKKPMTKDEVALLVDLIQSNPVLTTKQTNAATNKLKEECWASLTNTFNSKTGLIPRQREQLKLKWDNLKKAARKRAANVRMNNLKTGGGMPDFIPKDEILEKVTGVLGSTCSGFEVPFGGDGVGGDGTYSKVETGDGTYSKVETVVLDDLDVIVEEIHSVDATVTITNDPLLPPTIGTPNKRKFDFSDKAEATGGFANKKAAKHIYGMTSMSKPLQSKAKKLNRQDDGRLQRNLAMTRYYDKKTEKINLEIKLLKIELASKENNCNIDNQLTSV